MPVCGINMRVIYVMRYEIKWYNKRKKIRACIKQSSYFGVKNYDFDSAILDKLFFFRDILSGYIFKEADSLKRDTSVTLYM